MSPGSAIEIDAETLRRLYVDQMLTTVQIATHLRCSPGTVRRRLIRFGIPARPPGPPSAGLRRARAVPAARWSADVAYVVGLLATDGNLGRTGGSISIVSKDTDLLDTVRRCLRLTTPIKPHRGGYGNRCHHLAWRDRSFYDWLRQVGLTPAKSLTLGPLEIPDDYFADFFRGCIDGDGSILTYVDRQHVAKKSGYVYERLYVSIDSASRAFIEWLRQTVSRLTGLAGSITTRRRRGRQPMWQLRYAKAHSIRLIAWMYYSSDVPCLARKRARGEKFLAPLGHAVRATGRPRVGWLYDARMRE